MWHWFCRTRFGVRCLFSISWQNTPYRLSASDPILGSMVKLRIQGQSAEAAYYCESTKCKLNSSKLASIIKKMKQSIQYSSVKTLNLCCMLFSRCLRSILFIQRVQLLYFRMSGSVQKLEQPAIAIW